MKGEPSPWTETKIRRPPCLTREDLLSDPDEEGERMGTSFRQDSTSVTNISVIKDREVRLSVLTPLKCEPKMSCLSYIFFLCLIEKSRKHK